MIVSLKDYCKQLKARIALMQKNFDCAFTTALEEKVAKIKCQVEHEYSIRLKEEMAGYKAKLDSHYCLIIKSQLDTWHGIAEGHWELLLDSVHALHQAHIDMLQLRHEQYAEELEIEAMKSLEVKRYEFNLTISHLEQKMVQMHQHHLECLLRLKRRFLCSPEEVNCSDLEFWRIPDVPVEDECCGIDHYALNYSRWEALSVELQSLPLDEQISVLVHASLAPNVIGQFIAQSDKSYTNAVVLTICNFLGGNIDYGMSQPSNYELENNNAIYRNEDNSCFCSVNDCNNLKTALRSADFVPSRGDLVALLCKVTQADRSFVLNYVLSTQSCISLQPAVFIKQFSGHCSVKQQMEIIEMMRDELGPIFSRCGGVGGMGGCGDAANPFNACGKLCGADLCDDARYCETSSSCCQCSNSNTQCSLLDSFEKERECFAREMMSLIDMPLVSSSTVGHTHCCDKISTTHPHMSSSVYVPPLQLDSGEDLHDCIALQCSECACPQHSCQSRSRVDCGVDLLQRKLDNLVLQKCFGERRMAEILEERTEAMHCHIMSIEEELRKVLMHVENYM
ncbi:uncharacterized protein LOC142336580 [Convolutriloba macropyga]|uniref:uncharacterized protein LOC142336580 n=1 Tax=Convolutriloba macropyga TaxID=536237 RepID=UPI003F524AF9